MSGMWAYGAQFRRGDGATPETFATVADVREINGVDLSRNTDDVTAHDSPEGWMEFIGTLKDAGEISLTLNYRPTSHDQFVGDLSDAAPRNYKIVVPSSPAVTWSFAAIMTGFTQGFPVDGKATGTFTYKITGKPTFV
jgi:predicted secreted protein